MKTLIFCLLLVGPVFAADSVTYDSNTGKVSMTFSPAEREILRRAARHVKVSEVDLIKQTNENWVKNVSEMLIKVREQNLRERYEKLTPEERKTKTIDEVMGQMP